MLLTMQPITEFLATLTERTSTKYYKHKSYVDLGGEQSKQRIRELEAENIELRKQLASHRLQAYRDPLTGIANRRAYDEKLSEEISRCMRNQKVFSLVIWDIDLFKQINDDFGHQTGDQVLRAVAKKLNSRMRKSDFTARIGGEEFISLFIDCDQQQAFARADSLREEIAQQPIQTNAGDKLITISCGVSQFSPNINAETLFSQADRALYQAKHNGRNRVCRA
ncbi:GGDEF domain-containing protein [Amphritea sp.]|uniref:GGDEF domain-containing protein n=1 Tax=Amphritea sp. TaxID=1872502 RepID=UPI0025B97AC8|nr:GGDEF domain-containing protein [Amphritea sp.]